MTFTNYDDLIGQKFGRLTIISETEPRLQPNGKKMRQCICDCDCGAKGFVVPFIYLTRGVNKSCGCLIKERNKRGADKREIVKNRKVERHERRLKREAEIKRTAGSRHGHGMFCDSKKFQTFFRCRLCHFFDRMIRMTACNGMCVYI